MSARGAVRMATIAAVAAGACLTSVAGAATEVTNAACGTFSGPAWSYVDPMKRPPLRKGTTWKVIARGVPCSFATTWAKALVKTPFRGEAMTRFASPKGWTCTAGGGITGGGKGTPGSCSQGTKSFAWGGAGTG